MEVITERSITINEALSALKKRQKDGALSYEQQHTLNYLEDLVRLEDKDAAKLVKELKEIGLTESQAAKLCDLLPKKEEEVKLFLGTAVKDDVAKKVFEAVKEFKKKASEPAKTKKIEVIERPKEALAAVGAAAETEPSSAAETPTSEATE